MLDFNKYQIETRKTKIYSDDIIYPSLGLSGEVGELMNQIKKIYRDDHGRISFVRKQDLKKDKDKPVRWDADMFKLFEWYHTCPKPWNPHWFESEVGGVTLHITRPTPTKEED